MTSIAYHLFYSQLNIINQMKKILSIVQTNLVQSHQMGNINNQPTRSTANMIKVNLILQQQIFQGSKSDGKSSSSISSFILNANDLLQNNNDGNGPILKQKRKSNIFSKRYWRSRELQKFRHLVLHSNFRLESVKKSIFYQF